MISIFRFLWVYMMCILFQFTCPPSLFAGFVVNFSGPMEGKIVDAVTGEPIPDCELRLLMDVCLGFENFNPGGCNPSIIYDHKVFTDSNGNYKFPFHVIYKNPIGAINRIKLTVNNLHQSALLYERRHQSIDIKRDVFVEFSGRLSGYEQLDVDLNSIAWSKKDFRLVPLKTPMNDSDCPATMADIERRRCLEHVAIRKKPPSVIILDKLGNRIDESGKRID